MSWHCRSCGVPSAETEDFAIRAMGLEAENAKLRELAGELIRYLVRGTPNDITPILARAAALAVKGSL